MGEVRENREIENTREKNVDHKFSTRTSS